LVLELLDGKTLWEHLQKNGKLPKKMVKYLAAELIIAIGKTNKHTNIQRKSNKKFKEQKKPKVTEKMAQTYNMQTCKQK
jgi:hypothetical protein